MNRIAVLTAEAESDLEDVARWYQNISPGLGLRLIDQVRASVSRIEFMPEMFAKVHGDIRRTRVKRFPYGVFYRVGRDRIDVIAIMHNRRHPAAWQNRA